MSPLSKIQKRDIAIAARKAYQAWPEREAFEAINSEQFSPTACFNEWRHVEQGKAVGVQSLRECDQSHYGRILAHFQRLAGDTAAATRTEGRDADNDRRIARWKLNQELQARGLETGYAVVICRQKFKCELDQASAGQLWKLVYDVRMRKKHRPAKPAQEPGEVPF